ncbi:MAG: hypothetical protein K2M07_05645 [Muribaculaceae bacterium]|nr:hypothetical protein [Muribaculaceae bacterium]
MLKRIITLLFLLPAVCLIEAQTLNFSEKSYHLEGGLYAGFNTDGYEIDGGVSYFFNRFVGVRCGIGVAGEIGSLKSLSIAFDDDDQWLPGNGHEYYDNEITSLTRLRFIPAMVLRSPCLYDWKEQDVQLYLFAEPGVVLSTPGRDSHGAKWFNLMLRAGVNMQVDRWVFTLGYGISDFSLTSGIKGIEHPNHLTNTVFIGAAYKF